MVKSSQVVPLFVRAKICFPSLFKEQRGWEDQDQPGKEGPICPWMDRHRIFDLFEHINGTSYI